MIADGVIEEALAALLTEAGYDATVSLKVAAPKGVFYIELTRRCDDSATALRIVNGKLLVPRRQQNGIGLVKLELSNPHLIQEISTILENFYEGD